MGIQEQHQNTGESLSNRILFIFITICSLSLFMLKGLGKGERVIEVTGVVVILFFLILYAVYYKEKLPVKRKFSFIIILIFLCVLGSDISSLYFKNQPIKLTLFQQLDIYYLFLYFLLHFLNLKYSWIKDFIYYTAIICAVMYLLQYIAYPREITRAQMFIDRGTLRINLPGVAFRHLGYFLCITELFKKFNRKYAIGAFLLLVVTILSAFRSMLAMYVLLPAVYLLISKHVRNRFVIIFVSIIISVSGFMAFHGIIEEMNQLAVKESSEGKDYIRVRAGAFFLEDAQRNRLSLVFGNGVPSPYSDYGIRITAIMATYGFYLSDVGIVGTLYKFGGLFSVIMLGLLFRIVFIKGSSELNFIKLFIVMQVLLMFTTFPFFEQKSGIVILALILYIIEYQSKMSSMPNEVEN
jgi:hypothetical protein